MKKIIITLSLIPLLFACTNEQMGTGIGAGAGAILGSTIGRGSGKAAAMMIGGIAGSVIGNRVGNSMDQRDAAYYNKTSYDALENSRTGQENSWVNPDTGNRGSFVIQNTYKNQSGLYCREFQNKIVVSGKTQDAYGTACRQPDGTWKIVG